MSNPRFDELHERWLRDHEPQPTAVERFAVVVKAFGVAMLFLLIALFACSKLFSGWFPELAATPK